MTHIDAIFAALEGVSPFSPRAAVSPILSSTEQTRGSASSLTMTAWPLPYLQGNLPVHLSHADVHPELGDNLAATAATLVQKYPSPPRSRTWKFGLTPHSILSCISAVKYIACLEITGFMANQLVLLLPLLRSCGIISLYWQ